MTPYSRSNGRGRPRTLVYVSYLGSSLVTVFILRAMRFRTFDLASFRRHYREGR